MDDEYLVTAFVPSDTACLASSPGRISLTLQKSKRLRWAVMPRHDSRGLNLTGGNGGLLVVRGQLGCLSGDTLEDICKSESDMLGVKS